MFEDVAQTGSVFIADGEPDLSRTDSSAKTIHYRALVLNLAMAIITRNATPVAQAIPNRDRRVGPVDPIVRRFGLRLSHPGGSANR